MPCLPCCCKATYQRYRVELSLSIGCAGQRGRGRLEGFIIGCAGQGPKEAGTGHFLLLLSMKSPQLAACSKYDNQSIRSETANRHHMMGQAAVGRVGAGVGGSRSQRQVPCWRHGGSNPSPTLFAARPPYIPTL